MWDRVLRRVKRSKSEDPLRAEWRFESSVGTRAKWNGTAYPDGLAVMLLTWTEEEEEEMMQKAPAGGQRPWALGFRTDRVNDRIQLEATGQIEWRCCKCTVLHCTVVCTFERLGVSISLVLYVDPKRVRNCVPFQPTALTWRRHD